MNGDQIPLLHQPFPGAHFDPQTGLWLWFPQGVVDDRLAEELVAHLEAEERASEVPFNRYIDLTGVTAVRVKFGHSFDIAARRRAQYQGPPVKSALFCPSVISLGMGRMYQALMKGGPIQVRAFRQRDAAAEWLGVPCATLVAQHEIK